MQRPIRIHLTYSPDDGDRLNPIRESLEAQGAIVTSWSRPGIVMPESAWRNELPDKLKQADFVLVFLSSRKPPDSQSRGKRFVEELAAVLQESANRPPNVPFVFAVLLQPDALVPESLTIFPRLSHFHLDDDDRLFDFLLRLDLRHQINALGYAAKSSSQVLLASVELENIRCFDRLSVSFEDGDDVSRWNVLLGDNACGKTTLLRCIALGLCDERDASALLASIPGTLRRSGTREGVIRLRLKNAESDERFEIETRIKDKAFHGEFVRQVVPDGFPRRDVFLCGYGTSRATVAHSSFDEYSLRKAAATLFDEQAPLWNPEVVFLRRSQSERESLERRLLKILLLDSPSDSLKSDEKGLIVGGPWGELSLDVLSDGYRRTTQWLLDYVGWAILAGRLEQDGGVGGILLIDELEQHLHPRWQRHIVNRLRQQLPKTQIIATTHTPLIAAGAADVDSASIHRFFWDSDHRVAQVEAIKQEELRGKRADQILTSPAFGLTTTRSPGSVDEVNRYTALFGKKRSPEEDVEFRQLQQRLEDELQSGETEYERSVAAAVNEVLTRRLQQPPSQPLSYEVKRQLRELLGSDDLQP